MQYLISLDIQWVFCALCINHYLAKIVSVTIVDRIATSIELLNTSYIFIQIRDSGVKELTNNCPLLSTLVIANCPLVTDESLFAISSHVPQLR